MDTDELNSHGSWHRLFDALCNECGWYDNSELASLYCKAAGKRTQRDFESARRTLREWRIGTRTPLRRNVVALAKVLDVDAEPEVRARWDLLYRAVRSDAGCQAPPAPAAAAKRFPVRKAAAIVGLLGAGLIIGGLAQGRIAGDLEPVDMRGLPTVAYNARVVVSVGASKLVNGALAGGCDGAPPDWEEMLPRIPESGIGLFEDGGLATQMRNSCNGERIVRAVRFTGLKPGSEELKVLGAYLRIEVVGPSGLAD